MDDYAFATVDEYRIDTGDAVTDAARKKLVQPACAPMGVEDLTGVSQSSFTANGFQGSFTFQNPSGTAYFDRSTLTALKRLLGRGQRIGTVCPSYGGRP